MQLKNRTVKSSNPSKIADDALSIFSILKVGSIILA